MAQVNTSSDLVICMPMDGNAQDMSGNNNHGTVFGATLTTDRFGNLNSAYHFNGISDYIQVAGSNSLDSIEYKNELTITIWASVYAWYQNWNVFSFVDKYNSIDDHGWLFELQNPLASGLGILFVGDQGNNSMYSATDPTVFNHWDFYALTYSKSHNFCKIYKNANLVATLPNNSKVLEGTNNGLLYIGYSPSGPDEYSNGDMDDLRMYSRALNDSEVLAIYNGQTCNCLAITVNSPTVCSGQSATLTAIGSATAYLWSPGGETTSSITVSPTSSITYTVIGSSATCTTQAVSDVSVIDKVKANVDIDLSDSCQGNINFKCSNNSATNSWTFSDGEIRTNVFAFTKHYSANGAENVVFITNPNTQCADTTQKYFYVNLKNSNGGVFPNVFTPNEDGINDVFDFSNFTGCNEFQFEIFDRWGLSMMKTEKVTFWDGHTTSGIAVPDGVYFYILKTANNSYKGTVTIFR